MRNGSFVAQDDEYPSNLVITLTATDSGGLSAKASIEVRPETNVVTLASEPAGLSLVLGGKAGVAPLSAGVLAGGVVSVNAPDQLVDGVTYRFAAWSDGGTRAHDVVASTAFTFTATFTAAPP